MGNILKPSSGVTRTTAKPSAVRNKYDPRIGNFSHGIKPDNVHYPCPKCGRIEYMIKYTGGGKVTICRCGYETVGDFEAVIT